MPPRPSLGHRLFLLCAKCECNYVAKRTVTIRDRKLGLLHRALMGAVLAYVVGWVLVRNKGYMKVGDLAGSLRMALLEPGCAFRLPHDHLRYCGANGTYSYHGNDYLRFPCRTLDATDAVYPTVEAHASFLTTRVKETPEVIDPRCVPPISAGPLDPECTWGPDPNRNETYYYVSDVTTFTLLLDHTMAVPEFGVARTSKSMRGSLKDLDGNKVDVCAEYQPYWDGFQYGTPPTTPPPAWCDGFHASSQAAKALYEGECVTSVGLENQHDRIPIKSLLHASGVQSLDHESGLAGEFGPESSRFAGIVLQLDIHYSNMDDPSSFDENDIGYTYTVHAVPNAEFKVEQVVPGTVHRAPDRVLYPDVPPAKDVPPAARRTVLSRHGLRLIVTQSGRVGTFDFPTLLIAIVAGLGLMSVAKTGTDIVMASLMRDRAAYKQYRTAKTVDFSDLSATDIAAFQEHDLINPPPRLDRFEGTDAMALERRVAPPEASYEAWKQHFLDRRHVMYTARPSLGQYIGYWHILGFLFLGGDRAPARHVRHPVGERLLCVALAVCIASGLSLSYTCESGRAADRSGDVWVALLVSVLMWAMVKLWRAMLSRHSHGLRWCGAPWRVVVASCGVVSGMVACLFVFAALPAVVNCVHNADELHAQGNHWEWLFLEILSASALLDIPRLAVQYYCYVPLTAAAGAFWDRCAFGSATAFRHQAIRRNMRTWHEQAGGGDAKAHRGGWGQSHRASLSAVAGGGGDDGGEGSPLGGHESRRRGTSDAPRTELVAVGRSRRTRRT